MEPSRRFVCWHSWEWMGAWHSHSIYQLKKCRKCGKLKLVAM